MIQLPAIDFLEILGHRFTPPCLVINDKGVIVFEYDIILQQLFNTSELKGKSLPEFFNELTAAEINAGIQEIKSGQDYVLRSKSVLTTNPASNYFNMYLSLLEQSKTEETLILVEIEAIQESYSFPTISVDQTKNTEEFLINFINDTEHDLRNLMNNVNMLFHIEEKISTKQKTDFLKDLNDYYIGRLETKLKNLKDFFSPQTNLPYSSSSLEKIIQDILQEFQPLFASLEAEVQYDIKQCPFIEFNELYLKSIIKSILNNSIKFRVPGRKLIIQMQSELIENYRLFSLKDNGKGINPEAQQHHLFTPSSDTGTSENGISLHLIKNMMEKYGGKIEVESTPGEGTTIRLYFIRSEPSDEKSS